MKHVILKRLSGCVWFLTVLEHKPPFPQPCCPTPPAQVKWKFHVHVFGLLIHWKHPLLTYSNYVASSREQAV